MFLVIPLSIQSNLGNYKAFILYHCIMKQAFVKYVQL